VIGVSAEFAQAINLSHQIAVEAAVLTATGETPVDVLDGTVSLDANAASRGRLDITLPRDLVPTGATSLLAPFGNELRVGRGIEFPDGTREIVPLGVYRIPMGSASAGWTARSASSSQALRTPSIWRQGSRSTRRSRRACAS
jgi:hypothetical protein